MSLLTAKERKARRKTWTLPDVIKIPVQNEDTEEIVEQIVFEKTHDPIVNDAKPRYRKRSVRLLPPPSAVLSNQSHLINCNGNFLDEKEEENIFDSAGPLPSWCSGTTSGMEPPALVISGKCQPPAGSKQSSQRSRAVKYDDKINLPQSRSLRSLRSGAASVSGGSDSVGVVESGAQCSNNMVRRGAESNRRLRRAQTQTWPIKPVQAISGSIMKPLQLNRAAEISVIGNTDKAALISKREKLALWKQAKAQSKHGPVAAYKNPLECSVFDGVEQPVSKRLRRAASNTTINQSVTAAGIPLTPQRYDYKKNSKLATRECLAPQAKPPSLVNQSVRSAAEAAAITNNSPQPRLKSRLISRSVSVRIQRRNP